MKSPAQIDCDLFDAVENDTLHDVVRLIEAGANVNAKIPGMRANIVLHCSSVEVFKALVKAGVEIKDRTLADAVRPVGGLVLLQCLIDYGVPIDGPNDQYERWSTALMHAAGHANVEAVSLLLKNGANPNVSCSRDRWLALHLVVNCAKRRTSGSDLFGDRAKHEEVVSLLIDAGSKLDMQNDEGHTALMIAARHGLPRLAKLLLEAGANPHAIDLQNRTAEYHVLHAMRVTKRFRKTLGIIRDAMRAKPFVVDRETGELISL